MGNFLRIQNISKYYKNGTKALDHISFLAQRGEIIGLVGANGAGKSTLINIIGGVLRPTEGVVHLHITQLNQVSFVSQQTVVDWYLNVLDNVRLGARLGGFSYRQARAHALEALKKVDFETHAENVPDILSGGQLKRMQIARALAQDASLLLLDEPTVGLDPLACQRLMTLLKEMAREGKLIFLCSHDLSLLENYVDRILYLHEGRLVKDQPIREFVESYKANNLEQAYLNVQKEVLSYGHLPH